MKPERRPGGDPLEGAWMVRIESHLMSINNNLKRIADSFEKVEHEHPITVNITDNLFIGGLHMAKLNLTALNAAVAKNKSVGDVLDSIFDAIVEAIRNASGQAEIDALAASLESDNTREELRTNALKN